MPSAGCPHWPMPPQGPFWSQGLVGMGEAHQVPNRTHLRGVEWMPMMPEMTGLFSLVPGR